jgi:hypothetical protein
MGMYELKEILAYAESNNMMDKDFQTVLDSYKKYLADYFESLVADDTIEQQKSEEYYANVI